MYFGSTCCMNTERCWERRTSTDTFSGDLPNEVVTPRKMVLSDMIVLLRCHSMTGPAQLHCRAFGYYDQASVRSSSPHTNPNPYKSSALTAERMSPHRA